MALADLFWWFISYVYLLWLFTFKSLIVCLHVKYLHMHLSLSLLLMCQFCTSAAIDLQYSNPSSCFLVSCYIRIIFSFSEYHNCWLSFNYSSLVKSNFLVIMQSIIFLSPLFVCNLCCFMWLTHLLKLFLPQYYFDYVSFLFKCLFEFNVTRIIRPK